MNTTPNNEMAALDAEKEQLASDLKNLQLKRDALKEIQRLKNEIKQVETELSQRDQQK